MVDLVAKVVWFRICETAEKIITSLDINESSRMDPLGLLLLGWIVLAGIVYFATDYIRDLLNHFRGDVQAPNNQTGRIAAAPPRPALPALHTHTCTPESSISQRPDTLAPSGGGSASSSHPSSETLQARVKLINYSKEGSDWVNSVLNWLYHRYNTTPEFADIWLSALNEHAKRNAQQLGILVTFDRFLATSCAPKIGDVRAELSAEEQMSIFCSVETIQLGFHLLATVTDARGIVKTNSYEVDIDHVHDEIRFLNINDLRQVQPSAQRHTNQCFQLKLLIYVSQHNELFLSAEFEKEPRDVLVGIRTPAGVTHFENDFDSELVQTAVKQCIQNTVTTMRLARFRDFPFPLWHLPPSKPSSPVSSKEPLQTHFPFPIAAANGPKINPFGKGDYQVVVKVVRAHAVGDNAAGMEPYCVIEMDEPPQKHTTVVAKSHGANPLWEEKFILDVSPDSSEMLFELYDRTKPQKRNFLGTAIVSLHELQKNPCQRQIIPLQSRPLMDDLVSGSLTLEFSVLGPGGTPLSNNIMDVSAQNNSSNHASNGNRNNHLHASGPGMNKLAAGEFPSGEFRPGTSRVPSIQRSHSEDIPLSKTDASNNHKPKRKLTLLSVPKSATDGQIVDVDGSSEYEADGKGRKRKSSFFGRIKRRFSFGKKRSKSLEPTEAKEEMRLLTAKANGATDQSTDPLDVDTELLLAVERGRSRKADRKSRKDQKQRSKSAPGSREPSASRSTASNKSTRATWRDKLRSRFSRSQERGSTLITTQDVA